MRFKLPNKAAEHSPHQQQQGSCDVEEVPFCIPAEGVACRGCLWDEAAGCCWRPNCDALFTPHTLRRQQRGWQTDPQPQLIITAGPERSGSTWLYNAVRLLFQHAKKPLDAYWLKDVTDEALAARGAGRSGSNHVLIKTHAWSDSWDLSTASHIFITHRDLRQVLASYRRMTWEFDLPDDYVRDHMRWKEHAECNLAFEDIISRPLDLLHELHGRLDLGTQIDFKVVLQELSSLPVPNLWVDPVTQIWPNHISTPYMEARQLGSLQDSRLDELSPSTPAANARLDEEAAARLLERFADYFTAYGYSS